VTTTLPSSSSTVAPTTLPPRLGSSTVPVPTGVPTGEGELPDTGLAVVTLGGSGLLLVVLGGLSVWATRRRR
jgi:LPXTG-motif cell wall-anchored protein